MPITQKQLEDTITMYYTLDMPKLDTFKAEAHSRAPKVDDQKTADRFIASIEDHARLIRMDNRAKLIRNIKVLDTNVHVIFVSIPDDSDYFGFYLHKNEIDSLMQTIHRVHVNVEFKTLTGPIKNMTDDMLHNFLTNGEIVILSRERKFPEI